MSRGFLVTCILCIILGIIGLAVVGPGPGPW